MREKREKGLDYFTVLEALQAAKGCALCALESSGIQQHFDALLYESVNDVGVRRDLMESRGYCHRHAHILLGFRSGLGTAILYRDQVEEFRKFIDGLEGTLRSRKRGAKPTEWTRAERCPACAVQLRMRACNVGVLARWLLDVPMQSAFDATAGLCVPHFLLFMESTKDVEVRRHVVDVERKKTAELLKDLAEFTRKHDYRFSGEGFGKEADCWLRAVKMMVGDHDVFPP
jgi:hypothetical protein